MIKWKEVLLCLVLLLGMTTQAVCYSEPETPLTLCISCDWSSRQVLAEVRTNREIIISNYDLRLSWDFTALTLKGIAPGQEVLVPNYCCNDVAESNGFGTFAAYSGGCNVSLGPDECLARYTFHIKEIMGTNLRFTLYVLDAADEAGTGVSWKRDIVTEDLRIEDSLQVSLRPGGVIGYVTCYEPDARLFCASYGFGGELLLVESQAVFGDGTQHSYEFMMDESVIQVKLFLLDRQWRPLCEEKKV